MRKLLSLAVAAMVAFAGINAYATPVKAKKSAAKVEQTENKTVIKKSQSVYKELDLSVVEKAQIRDTKFAKATKVKAVKPVAKKARANETPIVPPFSETFDVDPEWTIIDANEDESTWSWNESKKAMVAIYNSANDMDDWLITPALQMEGGKVYPMTLDAWSQSDYFPEKVEVYLGTAATAEGMTIQLVPTTELGGDVQKLEANIVPPSDGVYYVGIHGCSDADEFYLFVDNLNIGAAASAEGPADITDLAAATTSDGVKITLTAPSKTIGGETITALTNVVLKRDGTVVKTWDNPTPGAALEFIDTDVNGLVTYTATASNGQGTTNEAVVKLFAGYLIPPFTEDYDSDASVQAYTIIDANGDGKAWTWFNTNGKTAMRISYNSTLAMDDWLITPAISLKAGEVYQLSIDAYTANYVERVEVMMGDAATVAAMTKTVIPATEIAKTATSEAPQALVGFITASEDGLYYIGVHGISDPDMYMLYIDNLSVSAPIDGGAPKAVEDLTVTPDPNCELKATVTFTCPTLNIAEQPVEALTEAEIYRGDELIATKTDITAGAVATYVDENAANGVNTYSVIVKNAKGASVPVSASAFVGVNKPADVENLTYAIGENAGQVILTWDPVTTTIEDLPLPSQFVTYNVCKYTSEIEPVLTGLTECTATIQVCDPEATADFYQYLVIAETAAGTSDSYAVAFFAAGAPETLPWIESFADGTLSHPLALNSTSQYFTAGVAKDDTFTNDALASVDGDNGFIYFDNVYMDYGYDVPGRVGLMTVNIEIPEDSNPALTFSVFNIAEDDENTLDVIINGETVKTINTNEGELEWIDHQVDLTPYKGKLIQVEFSAYLCYYNVLLLDNIVMLNVVDNEVIARSINAPATIKANAEFDVTVEAANMGSNAQAIDVTLYRNGKAVETITTEELQFMESETVVFNQKLTPIEAAENVYYAVVEGQDTDETNNQTPEVTVLLNIPNYPTPTEAVANGDANSITVTWDEPAASAGEKQPVTEDFEDAESFAQAVNGWTFVDADLQPVGGIQDTDIPGIEPGTTPLAWFVFDSSVENFDNEYFAAHSGNKYLSSMFNYDGESSNDDWMISPALCGDAQTISLWAKSYSVRYGSEIIELLYTTASAAEMETESFVSVKTVELPAEWTEVEFNVPEGAKHFAIRCISGNAFMCFVDDVTYIPADAETVELELKGYNVYRDGVLIAEGIEETSYVDTDVQTDTEYTYVITAVYVQGESAGSNEAIGKCAQGLKAIDTAAATISTTSNSIIVANANGMNVTISSVDGKVLYNGAGDATVAATKGVYVVKVGKKVAKVIVR